MTVIAVLLALLSALGNAASTVLQRRAATENEELHVGDGGAVGWLRTLIRRPLWLFGVAALALSGVFQAAALGFGRLSVVQPVMASELLFTLALASVLFRRRPGRLAWWSFLALAVGLTAFLLAIDPSGGTSMTVDGRWLIAVPPAVVAVVVLMLVARRLRPSPAAAVLGIATSICFAYTAALMKDAVSRLADDGVVGLLTAWQTYATAIVGLAAMLLLQATMRAGTLVASQPALTLTDALLSVVLGALLFEEKIHLGWRILPALLGLALMAFGTLGLAHSPEISGEPKPSDKDGPPRPANGKSSPS